MDTLVSENECFGKTIIANRIEFGHIRKNESFHCRSCDCWRKWQANRRNNMYLNKYW